MGIAGSGAMQCAYGDADWHALAWPRFLALGPEERQDYIRKLAEKYAGDFGKGKGEGKGDSAAQGAR